MPLNDRRVVRGGSWNNNPQNLRSANRNRNNTDEANNNLGFRIASTPAIVPEPDHSRIIRACRGCPYAASPGCAVLPTKESAVFGRRQLVARLPLFISAAEFDILSGNLRQ
ncbi:SUMF1/EgtB/PvdO family nonheme iron enzyme [Nitrosomonas sp.]|uniref:SUMF1/EgtB/PvdO family nonheme iron enzyme n=1 Tax=Nitrosomonas sp. TaxID=42353 RepID=UPI0034559859